MPGLLFSQMEPPGDLEAEFHDWYENEHIPVRMSIPGFAEAVRYEAVSATPRFLACYYLDDLTALESPEYRHLKREPGCRTARILAAVHGFTRYTCSMTSDTAAAGAATSAASDSMLFVVAFSVPQEDLNEFDAWYEEEHIPLLMRADGWLRIRRYRVLPGHEGPRWTHVALHELRDGAVLDPPEGAVAGTTPRRERLSRAGWFGRSSRLLYRPIHHVRSTTSSRAGR